MNLSEGRGNRTSFFLFTFIFLAFAFNSAVTPNAGLYAQESILSSYERNFIRASLSAKTGILTDAATDGRAKEFIGDLYQFALRFALDNSEHLRNDPDMIALIGTAARGAGTSGNTASVNTLWDLFLVYPNSYSRVEILGALGSLGKGNPLVVRNLNQFLNEQNISYRERTTGQPGQSYNSFGAGQAAFSPDYSVLSACIAALGALGDDSSFPFLFSTMTAGYPQAVTQETLKALDSIQGNYKNYLVDIIMRNPFPEKAAAFRIGAYNEKLSPADRGEIAQTALEVSLNALSSDGALSSAESSLRYDAVTVLTRLKWNPAAPLAIRNFYQVRSDYDQGHSPKERLVEAIACLGVMGSAEAAQALALQLGYFNSQTENTGEYDEAVILALINALGELGDKAAFDYLLYISYLNYPDRIQAAAREALNRLKW